MAIQTVTIYPSSIVDAGITTNASNVLGYSTGSYAQYKYTGGSSYTSFTVKYDPPGFSGGEEIVEVRQYVEGYCDNYYGGTSTTVSLGAWWYNNSANYHYILSPPGYFPNSGGYQWASTTYNAAGAVRTHSSSSNTNPFGTYQSGGSPPDPLLSIANATEWQNQMEIPLFISVPGYTGATSRIRRTRIEIDYEPAAGGKVKDAGVWKDAGVLVKDGGIWKEATPSARDAGIWKPTV